MEIREIHIDGFGMFANRHITGFTSGMNVIYGENEFGKSTLLEFIRRILFGFPRSLPTINPYPAFQGGHYGGTLVCELDSGQMGDIARRPGPRGGHVTITMDGSQSRGQDAVNRILGHMTKAFYENVYAISLDELQAVRSLQTDEVKSHLYGAGIGLGSVSLNEVQHELRAQAEEIFKPRGSSQKIPLIYNQIRKLEHRIRDIQKGLKDFDHLARNRDALIQNVHDQEAQIHHLEVLQKNLENQHKLFPHYQELIRLESECAQVKDLPHFSEDALSHFNEIKMGIADLEKRIHEEIEVELKGLKSTKEDLTYNEDLINQESIVNGLLGFKEKLRSAFNDLEHVQAEKEKIRQRIQDEIKKLGQRWSGAAIKDFHVTHQQHDRIRAFRDRCDYIRSKRTRIENKMEHHQELKAAKPSEWFTGLDIYRYAFYFMAFLGFLGLLMAMFIQFYLQTEPGWLWIGLSGVILFSGISLSYKMTKDLNRQKAGDPLEEQYKKELQEVQSEYDHFIREWQHFLKEIGFDETLSPEAAEDMIKAIEDVRNDLSRSGVFEKRVAEMQNTIKEVESLCDRVRPSIDQSRLSQDIITNIEIIAQQLKDEKDKMAERKRIEIQIRALDTKMETLLKKKEAKEETLQSFIASHGIRDEETFKEKYHAFLNYQALQKKIAEIENIIQSSVGTGECYERFMASLSDANPDAIELKLNKIKNQIRTLKEERDRQNRSIGEISNQIKQLSTSEDLLMTQTEAEMKKQQLQDLSGDWLRYGIALMMLKKAVSKYENTRQPRVIQAASAIFSNITHFLYLAIIKPVNEEDIQIRDQNGNKKGIQQMSKGTREQLYFAMRLGLIEEYESRSESMPVIMDDILVNFDERRMATAANALVDFSKRRQVIVMTCHRQAFEKYLRLGAREPVFSA